MLYTCWRCVVQLKDCPPSSSLRIGLLVLFKDMVMCRLTYRFVRLNHLTQAIISMIIYDIEAFFHKEIHIYIFLSLEDPVRYPVPCTSNKITPNHDKVAHQGSDSVLPPQPDFTHCPLLHSTTRPQGTAVLRARQALYHRRKSAG
jgi:hypothetical protein